MTDPCAFTGVLTAIKPLKTSGDVQFIITVTKEMANEALRRAGGFVDPAKSRWVAVAVMDIPIEEGLPVAVEDNSLDIPAFLRRGA